MDTDADYRNWIDVECRAEERGEPRLCVTATLGTQEDLLLSGNVRRALFYSALIVGEQEAKAQAVSILCELSGCTEAEACVSSHIVHL